MYTHIHIHIIQVWIDAIMAVTQSSLFRNGLFESASESTHPQTLFTRDAEKRQQRGKQPRLDKRYADGIQKKYITTSAQNGQILHASEAGCQNKSLRPRTDVDVSEQGGQNVLHKKADSDQRAILTESERPTQPNGQIFDIDDSSLMPKIAQNNVSEQRADHSENNEQLRALLRMKDWELQVRLFVL
jgi:hypothetical protein